MARAETHARLSARLAALDDATLEQAVNVPSTTTGIGGAVSTVDIDGTRVFVKRIPLTAREAAEPMSTVNLFGLPAYCHYGVSSPGFGAWRELAAQQLTSAWVLSGICPRFPLLYHWRVLPRPAPSALTGTEAQDVERQFLAWGQLQPIRERFTERYLATSSIVLFLEYIPHVLRSWLAARHDALAMVERELIEVTSVMRARGLVHFDMHFENVLTDGEHLFVSDFGQASSDAFDLSPDERAQLASHADFDLDCAMRSLANLVSDPAIRERYGARASVMNAFFTELRHGSKTTPYPGP